MLIIIYADHMLIPGRTKKEVESTQGHFHLASATFRVSSEFKEICASTMSGNRIPGLHCKFCKSDFLTALAQNVQQELDIDFRIDQTFRPLMINHPSSCTSSLRDSESSTVTDTVSEIEGNVSNECKIDSLNERGNALVDAELTTFKWEAFHPESSRPGVDRCLKKG